ncbi:excisionase family DNA-binding protein [Cystobacter fuscus]
MTAQHSSDVLDAPRALEPVAVTGAALLQVQRLAQLVDRGLRDEGERPRFSLIGPDHESALLPSDVLMLLKQLLAILASEEAVTVMPVHKELTTQEAANLLNVSRQYLVQLLDEGRSPSIVRARTGGSTARTSWRSGHGGRKNGARNSMR